MMCHVSDIFPPAPINEPSTTASAAGSIERPSVYEPVVIACSSFATAPDITAPTHTSEGHTNSSSIARAPRGNSRQPAAVPPKELCEEIVIGPQGNEQRRLPTEVTGVDVGAKRDQLFDAGADLVRLRLVLARLLLEQGLLEATGGTAQN